MIVSSVLAFARSAAQTDSNGLRDEDGLVFANEANQDFHRRLIEKGIDASQVQEASILGVVNQGVYNYPTRPASILALKTIEVNYQSNNTQGYVVAEQVDVSNLPNKTSFGWLRTNADPAAPKFDDRGNKFEIFPTPTAAHNLTALMNIFYYAKPSVFTAVSNTVQYPEEIDAAILGYRVAANYLFSLNGADNMAAAERMNMKYDERVKQYVSTFGRGSQQPIQPTIIQDAGWQY